MKHLSDLGLEDSPRATQAVTGLPADVWESLIPKDNPMTAEKVSLGEKPAILGLRNCGHSSGRLAEKWGQKNKRKRHFQFFLPPFFCQFRHRHMAEKRRRNALTVLNSMFNERSVYNVSAQGRADGIRQTLNQGGWRLVAGGWLQLSVKFSINHRPPAANHQPPTYA